MILGTKRVQLPTLPTLQTLTSSKGKSRKVTLFKNALPLQYICKQLHYSKK